VRRVAESFSWPFRARPSTWVWGVVSVLLLPILFIPLLGYAIDATRVAEADSAAAPPPWRFTPAQLRAGAWTALVLVAVTAPFVLLVKPLATVISGVPLAPVFAVLVLALPWGFAVLLHLPHATARFATSRNPRDLVDVAASLRGVRSDFVAWNAVVAAIVTAWAIGLACAGLLCVGIVPGVFYAILVSAHAAATLHPAEGPHQGPSTR
jgi:hypothetical protein